MAVRQATGFMGALRKWAYNMSGFNKYGLRHDDVLNEMLPDVQEAVRRLPQHIVDERNFRIIRALHLSMNKTYLPKEQWTKWEEDERYLQPYLDEVRREREEKAEWNTK